LIESELKENDLLLVNKIDRCSRSTLEFLKLQEKFYFIFKRFSYISPNKWIAPPAVAGFG
jgi:hypothetical protein